MDHKIGMKILGVIPARYESSRFPGKPLALIHGKSMIRRVYEQVSKSAKITKVVVATDDERILKHVHDFGGLAVMTAVDHTSGTERCAEVASKFFPEFDVVINIQGDEPFIDESQIDLVCQSFEDRNTEISTLIKKIETDDELWDANRPKVVIDKQGFALYFSRQTIPFLRSCKKEEWLNKHTFFKHIGIYGYKKEVLLQITCLPASDLEISEQLEQLRWLENGFKIKTMLTDKESMCVDTQEDLDRILKASFGP